MRSFIQLIENLLSEISISSEGGAQMDFDRFSSKIGSLAETINDLSIHEQADEEEISLTVVKDGVLLAILLVFSPSLTHLSHWSIGRIETRDGYQGRGLMRLLIEWFTHHRGPLMSDDVQSVAAQQMWQSLMERPNRLKLFLYDNGEETELPFQNRSPAPWQSTNARIIARYSPLTEEMDRLDVLRRTRGDRHVRWYGDGTSQDGYTNP